MGDKTAAETLASKVREKLKSGELQIAPERKIPTFGEYAEKWLATYGETQLKYSNVKGYESILRIHLQPLGDRPLNQITRTDVKDLIFAKLKDGLSPGRVIRIKVLVSSILTHALEDGLIAANPVSRLGRLIKGKDRKAAVNPLTRDEARLFLDTVYNHYPRLPSLSVCSPNRHEVRGTSGPGVGGYRLSR